MLTIYLGGTGDNVVNFNDVFFNKYTSSNLDLGKAKEVVKIIDDCILTDESKVISKFTGGELDLSNLSTGCKTVLNVLFNKNKIFNAEECGTNALYYLYKLSNGSIYLKDIVTPLSDCFSVNIRVVYNDDEFLFSDTDKLGCWYKECVESGK